MNKVTLLRSSRHCEPCEAIQFPLSRFSGSPRRFAPRDDGSGIFPVAVVHPTQSEKKVKGAKRSFYPLLCFRFVLPLVKATGNIPLSRSAHEWAAGVG